MFRIDNCGNIEPHYILSGQQAKIEQIRDLYDL